MRYPEHAGFFFSRSQKANNTWKAGGWILFLSLCLSLSYAVTTVAGSPQQTASTATVPVSMVVSAESRHGGEVPAVHREDVRVLQGHERLKVTDWVPLKGEQGDLQLYVVIDEGTSSFIGAQFDDLRRFIKNQPASALVGLAYMDYGTVKIVQDLTKDHDLVAKSLRLPLAIPGISSSPYLSLADLIQRWPESTARREILMISSGIDVLQPGPMDSYLDDAIARAQRAGISLYTIYASAAGHLGHSYWRILWGQYNISRLADETGGESYFLGMQSPVNFGPYLDEYADRLRHQYRLTFLATPGKTAGLQKVRVETELSNTDLVAADQVYVPLAK